MWIYKGLLFIHALILGYCIIFSEIPPNIKSDREMPLHLLGCCTNMQFLLTQLPGPPFYTQPGGGGWDIACARYDVKPRQRVSAMGERKTTMIVSGMILFYTLLLTLPHVVLPATVRPTRARKKCGGLSCKAIALNRNTILWGLNCRHDSQLLFESPMKHWCIVFNRTVERPCDWLFCLQATTKSKPYKHHTYPRLWELDDKVTIIELRAV